MRWFLTSSLMMFMAVMPLAARAITPEPFPQASLMDDKHQSTSGYRLILSGLKRNQAVTYASEELRVKADVWRRVWSVPEQVPFDELINHYSQQLAGSETLYQCRGLDCGSSNFWANEIFSNARLVGREQNQFYQVSREATGKAGETRLYVLYLVQRGSRQLMVNLDVVTTQEPVSLKASEREQIIQAMTASSGWLPGFEVTDGQLDTEKSKVLLTELKNLSPALKRRLYLVVQCYEASYMSDNLQCSERLAKQLRVDTFDGGAELNITGQGALTLPPDNNLKPALRFVFWPGR